MILLIIIIVAGNDHETDQPGMTAEIGYTDATVLSEPEFQGESGIGTVLVEFKSPRRLEKKRMFVVKSAGIKAGDSIAIENVTFFPNGPEFPFDCMVAVPKKK
ncbi:MAG: hypothetical protein AAB649_04135 [Patescibacteria group bacterium]